MELIDELEKWQGKKVLIIGDALIDRYILGNADKLSPDAPVPNIKVEKSQIYLGAIGLVLQYIISLGGIPEICTIVGDDYEGDFFIKKIKELKVDSSNIIVDANISTPQITRIKAMNQHMLRLESDYTNEISDLVIEKFLAMVESNFNNIDAIILLDYETGALFNDALIGKLLKLLRRTYENAPIIARPNISNYYLYEGIDLLKINLHKALKSFSIDCYTDTSTAIAGKKIINSSKCENLLLNYLETDSFLFSKHKENIVKIPPVLKNSVRSYVAVGSVIMAVLGLVFASKVPLHTGAKIAMHAATLSAISPPVDFFNTEKLKTFIIERSLK
jgi:rfaE bifunctional protein kinase chain/domain